MLSNSSAKPKRLTRTGSGERKWPDTYGVAGMSLHPYNTTLYAKKSWFMFDNEIVCLGAGITCGDASGSPHHRREPPVGKSHHQQFHSEWNAITPTVGWSSNLPSATPSWCALSGTGGYYFPAGNSNLQATFTANTGSWSQINIGDYFTSLHR